MLLQRVGLTGFLQPSGNRDLVLRQTDPGQQLCQRFIQEIHRPFFLVTLS